jgi:hypothetical protein
MPIVVGALIVGIVSIVAGTFLDEIFWVLLLLEAFFVTDKMPGRKSFDMMFNKGRSKDDT